MIPQGRPMPFEAASWPTLHDTDDLQAEPSGARLLFAGLDTKGFEGCAIGCAGDGQAALFLERPHRIA